MEWKGHTSRISIRNGPRIDERQADGSAVQRLDRSVVRGYGAKRARRNSVVLGVALESEPKTTLRNFELVDYLTKRPFKRYQVGF